ncbi:hypothetical protein Barb4_02242 [Bacteroidales bacterium Barb4]|nr:hypothetical protein Barb4_02242 [Bacteroidales bacterium Barb4]
MYDFFNIGQCTCVNHKNRGMFYANALKGQKISTPHGAERNVGFAERAT